MRTQAKTESDRRYYLANRDKRIAYQQDLYRADPEKKKKYAYDRSRDLKIRAVRLKGGACEQCGFDDHPAALQFHHRDPAVKRFTVTTNAMGSSKKYPWEMILEEIAKCDLLCANCHFALESAWELEGFWP